MNQVVIYSLSCNRYSVDQSKSFTYRMRGCFESLSHCHIAPRSVEFVGARGFGRLIFQSTEGERTTLE